MTLALMAALSSAVIFLGETTGGLPPWASIVLTPTVVVGLLVTGTFVRGKDFEAATKRAEAWEARCNAAEERERETYTLAIPAIQESARATASIMAYLGRQER